MKVEDSSLKALIEGEKQFRVPLYQRQYTWRGPQFKQLWESLMVEYELVAAGQAEHRPPTFLGTIVLATGLQGPAENVRILQVVDGQQRLTTLLLALCAIRDRRAETDANAAGVYTRRFLVNDLEPTHSERRWRLIPSAADRIAFASVVDGPSGAQLDNPIGAGYRFFAEQLADGSLDLDVLTQAISQRLSVVSITIGFDEQPHRIFESLNATGVSLTQADLLRNFFFMHLGEHADPVYELTWRPMEAELGVEHLDGLTRVDLMRRGQQVKYEDVYPEHKKRLAGKAQDPTAVRSEVEDFARQARRYRRLVDPNVEVDSAARRHLWFLRNWGATTTFPLLLHVLERKDAGECSGQQWRRVLGLIESFVVRRHLAAFPAHSLSKLFVYAIQQLPEGDPPDEALHHVLSQQTWHWPSDARLRAALRSNSFYTTGRAHQRKMILERLEESFEDPEPVDLAAAKLSIEHILPQTLSKEWRVELDALGQPPDQVREELVHTIGNLTLTPFNGPLSNHPFARKQEIYADSKLRLSDELKQPVAWGREEILARADRLAEQAIMIWPAPLPGMDVDGGGFDWTRIESAVEAIPEGHWTSYADLAELGGTAAQPVGNHMTASTHLTQAYRVLTAEGKVSVNFKWHDPSDERDPKQVLQGEAVQFTNGSADPTRRLNAADLSALIDDAETTAV